MFCRKALLPGAAPSRLSPSSSRIRTSHNFVAAVAAATTTKPRIASAVIPQRRRGLATQASNGSLGEEKDIAIIGGGITGLTTAHYLAKSLPEGATVTIYESSDRLGGWIDTQNVEFQHGGTKNIVQFERGPRTLRSYSKDRGKMDDMVLYDVLNDVNLEPSFYKNRSRYINLGGKIVRISGENFLKHPTLRSIWLSIPRLIYRRFRHRLGTMDRVSSGGGSHPDLDMSMADFLRALAGRASPAFLELASAVMHGTWGGDINRLSAMSALRLDFWQFWYKQPDRDAMYIPEHEARILRHFGSKPHVRKLVKQSQNHGLVSFADGLGALPKAIAAGLKQNPNVKIKLGAPVTGLEYDGIAQKVMLSTDGDSGPTPYDRVISTSNAKHLAALTPGLLPSLSSVDSVTITAVNLWYPKSGLNAPNRGLGFLMPRRQPGAPSNADDNLLGVFFDSDALPRPAAESTQEEGTKLFVLFRGEMETEPGPGSGSGQDSQAVSAAREILQRHLGIDPSESCVALARVNRDCIPQHNVGHTELMASAARELSAAFGGRLAVAGPSYTANGVVGSMRSGYEAAESVAIAAHAGVGVPVTGLERFAARREHHDGAVPPPEFVRVPRKDLIEAGRDIEERKGAVSHFFG